jgi:hypothetical protein
MTELKPTRIFAEIEKLKDPFEMFNLVVANSYFAGRYGTSVPVEQSCRVYRLIKAKIEDSLHVEIDKLKIAWDAVVGTVLEENPDIECAGYIAGAITQYKAEIDKLKHQWISVKDGLLEETYDENGALSGVIVRTLEKFHEGEPIEIWNSKYAKVHAEEFSYWMPLPEPPTEKDK